MGFCIVRGCKSRSDSNNRGTKFHVIPRNVELREKWIQAIGRSNLPRSGSVCSKHFLPEDYHPSRSGFSESLLKTAIPSQNLEPPFEFDEDNDELLFQEVNESGLNEYKKPTRRRRRANIGRRLRHANRTANKRRNQSDEQRQAFNAAVRVGMARLRAKAAAVSAETKRPTMDRREEMSGRALDDIKFAVFYDDPNVDYSDHGNIGAINSRCQHCSAPNFVHETPGMCCLGGKVELPELESPPEPLHSLLNRQSPTSNHFRTHTQSYNECFHMTSFGAANIIGDGFQTTFKFSTMEFENENTFEDFSAKIENLESQKDKDLPALTCVDLFPDPPHSLSQLSKPQEDGSLADDDEFAGFKSSDSKSEENQTERLDELSSLSSDFINTTNLPQENIFKKEQPPVEDQAKSNNNVASNSGVPLSPNSYLSSAESVTSSASSSNKSKKRQCRQCDMHFRKKRELHEHLKKHITMPEIRIERLSDDHEKVKEYLTSLSPKSSPTHGSLKLKFKLLSSQNFEVVSSAKNDKPQADESRIKVLKASDIRCKPELTENTNLDPFTQNMSPKLPNSFLAPENKYFECPTFDGLEAFTDEMNHTADGTEDLLKKLLENNNKDSQSFPRENEWQSNANEFISIDNLAPRCNVCHMNFLHPKYLFEHKQITGHDLPNRMPENHPHIPTSQPDYRHHPQNNYMNPPHPSQNLPPLYQMAQMRGNFSGYVPRMNVRQVMHHHPQPSPPPGFHPSQVMMTRTPPPIYRMNGNPANYPPNQYMEKRPQMYGPGPQYSNNGNQQPNQNQEMMRQPIFLKSRLQKAIRSRAQGPTNEQPPPSTGILSEQTAIRPRFLGPTPTNQMPGQMHFQQIQAPSPPKQGEPPLKKIKTEPGQKQLSSPSPNGMRNSPGISNSPGLPVIQSVHGGVNPNTFSQMAEKPKGPPPSSSNEQTGQGPKGVIKNPKDVANMLANRGITVTHKGKTSIVPLANKGTSAANASAQEAVQKLQANNSVSIISKKKPIEINVSKVPVQGSDGSNRITAKFLSCPVITCKEKFLTVEGVNRHAFRWHGIPMPNAERYQKRSARCRVCHHVCASPELLQEHMRREHEPSVNEIGIPIVDLRNDEVKRKLAGLGIFNYVPLTAAGASTSSLAFPVVTVQGAANPSICNLLGLGASSVLSLGPVKTIAVRKVTHENK